MKPEEHEPSMVRVNATTSVVLRLAAVLLLCAPVWGCDNAVDANRMVPDATVDDTDGAEGDATDIDGTDGDAADPDGTDGDAADPDGTDGDAADPDGTDGDATNPGDVDYAVIECDPLPAPVEGACDVVPGTSALVVQGDILLKDTVVLNGEVLVGTDGRIECSGCDCSAGADYDTATLVSCAGSSVSPGLINAHDHITYDGLDPAAVPATYDHRHEWRRGLNGKPEISAPSTSSTAEIRWAELRQVLAGTTSVIGSGSTGGMIRNLDRGPADTEGLGNYDSGYETFPLADTSGQMRSDDCNYPEVGRDFPESDCYHVHVAEGVNDEARNEYLCLSGIRSDGLDTAQENSAFVHMIPLLPSDALDVLLSGTAVIWSPRSNVALYGATAPVTMYRNLGIELALGTDWTRSGSANMLRELACADYLNTNHYDDAFTPRELVGLATWGVEQAIGADGLIGQLETDYFADITVFADNGEEDPYARVVRAELGDVALVIRGGTPLAGDSAILMAMPGTSGCEDVQPLIAGRAKAACVQQEFGTSFASLQSANNNSYDIMWNGTPTGEPTCVPARSGEFSGTTVTDGDGDGVNNADDNCPAVFNPILPVNDGVQGDADEDGLGDVCDPCPLSSDNDECDYSDADNDGFDNEDDNCPYVSNDDQADADNDQIGDVCDACPNVANPNGQECPGVETTIYEVKQGNIDGSVRFDGVVSAVEGSGIFVQVVDAERDTTLGADFSGIYVFGDSYGASPGDLVTVDGDVVEYFGQLQINDASVEIDGSGAAPEPVVVTPAEVGSGAATGPAAATRSEALEGVLIRVVDVEVSSDGLIAARCCGAMDWVVEDVLRVGQQFFDTTPEALGTTVTITGPLMLRYEDWKIMPRDEDDIVVGDLGDPRVESFGAVNSDSTYAASALGTSVLSADIELTLDRVAPEGGATFSVTSDQPAVIAGFDVDVAEGAETATLTSIDLLDGTYTGPVALTVMDDGTSYTVTVEIYDGASGRTVSSVEPSPIVVPADNSVEVTVALDAPAGSGGVVVTLASADDSVASPAVASVSVPEGSVSASFVLNGGANGDVSTTLTASASGAGVTVDVDVSSIDTTLGLIVSEILYDTQGGDTPKEWVELYNGTASEVDLSDYTFGKWGGAANGSFTTHGLSGTIPAGGCVVIGGPDTVADNGNPIYDYVFNFGENGGLENGGDDADGWAIYEGTLDPAVTTIPVDVVMYGTTNTKGVVGADGNVAAAFEDVPANSSLERVSSDTFAVQAAPTPGTCAVVEP